MERITIKELKNHLKITKYNSGYYECIFTFLIPSADNPVIVIPLCFKYDYRGDQNKKLFINHCLYQISKEMLKVHHLYNIDDRFETIRFGSNITGYSFYNVNEIWDRVDITYKVSHIIKKETFRKLTYEYLAR